MDHAKDPDEYVLKFGPEKFEKLIERSISSVEYKVRNLLKEYHLEDISDKIKFLGKLAEILAKVDSNIERDIYVDKFSHDLSVGKEAIIAEIEKLTLKKDSRIKMNDQIKPMMDIANIHKNNAELENMVIYLLVQKDLKIYLRLSEVYKKEDAVTSPQKEMIGKLYDLYENGDINKVDLLSLCETDEESSILSGALIRESTKEDLEKLSIEVARKIEIQKMQNKKKDLIEKMKIASTEEERRLLEVELNELIINLAKK